MISLIQNIIKIIILPLYITLFYFHIFQITIWGPLIHIGIFMIGMTAFLRRSLPVKNFVIAFLLIGFYVYLYTTDYFNLPAKWLGLPEKNSKWWLYAGLYTLFITGFGIQFIIKKRKDSYQVFRTVSLIIVQITLASSIPFIMFLFGSKEFYFSYLWPLKIEYFYPQTIFSYPLPFILYSFLGSLILFPILALLFGKRFYCSWTCGCGGLAETFGDQWRHLSDKSKSAWLFEKISIHSILALAVISTFIILINWAVGKNYPAYADFAFQVQKFYGFFISFALAGAAGVGFYPILGSRVWCRFFCPMAALLGLIQKVGRYHIRVKNNMCISCGNCSTYCEMGIDVRSYAEENSNFTRASCVGCGICAHVCPRGVLKLENKKRYYSIDTMEKI